MALSGVDIIIANSDDYDSLASMASQAKVLLNCVGPVSVIIHMLFVECRLTIVITIKTLCSYCLLMQNGSACLTVV